MLHDQSDRIDTSNTFTIVIIQSVRRKLWCRYIPQLYWICCHINDRNAAESRSLRWLNQLMKVFLTVSGCYFIPSAATVFDHNAFYVVESRV